MPNSHTRQATLRDVADLAGVSYQTVWRVVNQHPHVASETRERVLQVVKELDYRPHRAAQVLTTGRSYILQLIIFEYAYGDPFSSVLHWARELGYAVVVTELEDPADEDSVREALGEMSQMIDGILMVMPYSLVSYEALRDLCHDRPFVVAGTELGSKMPSVVFDQWTGMRQVVEHLIAQGHREIAEISGPLENLDAQARHKAFEVYLGNHGLVPGPQASGDFEVGSGYTAARRFLDTGKPFTAVVVGNDLMALGAIRAFRESGLRVPEDVSVTGYDDIVEAAYFDPPLTTIRQDFELLGRESVEYLVALIEDHTIPIQQRVLYPELVVRQSVHRLSRDRE
ncbi:MAG: LacI family DNA-binding transcriptional regulator [Anaerolineae bacterium]